MDWIPCPFCQGHARAALKGEKQRIMARIRGQFACNPVVAGLDHAKFGLKPGALQRQLVRLERLGLLRSVRQGRVRRFYLVQG